MTILRPLLSNGGQYFSCKLHSIPALLRPISYIPRWTPTAPHAVGPGILGAFEFVCVGMTVQVGGHSLGDRVCLIASNLLKGPNPTELTLTLFLIWNGTRVWQQYLVGTKDTPKCSLPALVGLQLNRWLQTLGTKASARSPGALAHARDERLTGTPLCVWTRGHRSPPNWMLYP